MCVNSSGPRGSDIPSTPGSPQDRAPGSDGFIGYPVGALVVSAGHDVNSRAVLAILEILFALQESDGKSVGPLLTLPLGG